MMLIAEWKAVLLRAWSVRFNLFNALCSGLASGMWGFTMGWPWPLVAAFVAGAVGLSLAPILARIVWQPDFHPGDEE